MGRGLVWFVCVGVYVCVWGGGGGRSPTSSRALRPPSPPACASESPPLAAGCSRPPTRMSVRVTTPPCCEESEWCVRVHGSIRDADGWMAVTRPTGNPEARAGPKSDSP